MLCTSDIYALITYSTFVESFFIMMSVGGILWLRYKKPNIPRPIKVCITFSPYTFQFRNSTFLNNNNTEEPHIWRSTYPEEKRTILFCLFRKIIQIEFKAVKCWFIMEYRYILYIPWLWHSHGNFYTKWTNQMNNLFLGKYAYGDLPCLYPTTTNISLPQ